jgi:hypothetical protein
MGAPSAADGLLCVPAGPPRRTRATASHSTGGDQSTVVSHPVAAGGGAIEHNPLAPWPEGATAPGRGWARRSGGRLFLASAGLPARWSSPVRLDYWQCL